MPLVKALKSFRGRYGLIRAGTTFNCEPGYFNALEKKGWVETVNGAEAPKPGTDKRKEPAPGKDRNKPEVPRRAGKEPAAKGGSVSVQRSKSTRVLAARPDAGKTLTSRSLRADLRSSEKTPNASDSGAPNSTTETPDPDDDSDE